MAIIDRKSKAETRADAGKPVARIDADRFEKAASDPKRRALMKAADRYHAAAKQSRSS